MSEALYERYKDALRRGHVAALRSRNAEALEAYSEAARIAPDRALPLVGMAGVLVRYGKRQEALATYEAALDRAPQDEGALRGRAELLAAMGDRTGAADSFDRLAATLDAAARLPDAADAAGRALALAESRSRRSTVRGYVARLRDASGDAATAEALARATAVLDAGAGGMADAQSGGREAASQAGPGRERPEEGPENPVEAPAEPVTEPEAPPPPPFDPGRAIGAVEEAALGDDPAATRSLALAAASGHREAGQPSTAIDACYIALAGSPADPDLHLVLAELYLDQGWRALAADKLLLLDRLAELGDDDGARERVRTLAAARLADDPRVAALTAPAA